MKYGISNVWSVVGYAVLEKKGWLLILFGMQFLHSQCGAFGEKGMLKA